jgi:hypothetical protein
MLGVPFNHSYCKKRNCIHLYTCIQQFRRVHLSHRKGIMLFSPCFSVTKVEYYSSGSNWIGLLPTQNPQYTSLLIPPFEVMNLSRFTLTSMSTQIQAQFRAELTSLLAYTATSLSTCHLGMIFYSTTVLLRATLVNIPQKKYFFLKQQILLYINLC